MCHGVLIIFFHILHILPLHLTASWLTKANYLGHYIFFSSYLHDLTLNLLITSTFIVIILYVDFFFYSFIAITMLINVVCTFYIIADIIRSNFHRMVITYTKALAKNLIDPRLSFTKTIAYLQKKEAHANAYTQ